MSRSGDAGGAGLQGATGGEEPAVALVRIPRPELASRGHRTPILIMRTSSDSNANEKVRFLTLIAEITL